MLRIIVDKQIITIVLGVLTFLGVGSKCVVNLSLKRMVRAAGNMNKSNHPLIRLIRAKFEHACMVSETVENVEVFVDKYLYEYKVAGIRLHSLRRLEKGMALWCIVTGLLGAGITYSLEGMTDRVLRTGVIGVGLGILVYVFHLTTDENYRLLMARNYMVDYLQNVCLRKFEKVRQRERYARYEGPLDRDYKEEQEMDSEEEFDEETFEEGELGADIIQFDGSAEPERPKPGREVPSPQTAPEILPGTMPDPYPQPQVNPDTTDPIRAARTIQPEETLKKNDYRKKDIAEQDSGKKFIEEIDEKIPEKPVEKGVLIRQILEEFMA